MDTRNPPPTGANLFIPFVEKPAGVLPEPPRKRILVVDDEPDLCELISTRLYIAGFEAYSAHNGEECLANIANIRPHALILDLNMPEVTGFSVLRALRDNPALSNIPTMVLTGCSSAEEVKLAISLGARGYLTKPVTTKELLLRVAKLLKGQHGREPRKRFAYV